MIKSSLEIAMERAASVDVDPNLLLCEEKKKEGSRLAARAMADPSLHLVDDLRAHSDAQRACFLEGIMHVLLANLVLPTSQKSLENFSSVMRILDLLCPQLHDLGQEFPQKMRDYLEKKDQIAEHLAPQFSQMLRQKEYQLSQHNGRPVRLKLENLPEFQTAYKEQLYILETHYQEVVDQTHWHIKQCVDKYNATCT